MHEFVCTKCRLGIFVCCHVLRAGYECGLRASACACMYQKAQCEYSCVEGITCFCMCKHVSSAGRVFARVGTRPELSASAVMLQQTAA